MITRTYSIAVLVFLLAGLAWAAEVAAATTVGVPVSYQLPVEGALPMTYRVTLAILDPKNPDWIICQFARGVARTVTAENKGQFSEIWDGLDDNFMPVPPGEYAVKGIVMPARKWVVDGEYHSVTPRFVTGASAWLPTPEQWNKPEPFGGDPCGAPLTSVAVGPNGVATFYYRYLENGLNSPMFDLKKPVNYEQFLRAFNSGGAAGGAAVTTDGETSWVFSIDGGGPAFVHRTDDKPFGTDTTSRNHVFHPEAFVTGLASWRDPAIKETFVYVAQRGKLYRGKDREWAESDKDFIDKITVHEGDGGKIVGELSLLHPRALAVSGGTLYALHASENGGFMVSGMGLEAGVPKGDWKQIFTVSASIKPFDLAVDSRGRFYVSDPAANHVYQLDGAGKVVLTYGKQDAQTPGKYDALTLISPGKIATWKDTEGNDRLIIVEQAGPNRAAEWSSDGKLLREFLTLQTKANDGYAIDPEDSAHIFIAGQEGWLTRFNVDYEKRTWVVDAIWPGVGIDPILPGFDHPKFVRVKGRNYIACSRGYNVYRQDGNRWVLSAGVVRKVAGGKQQCFAWHDANGDGEVQEEEYRDHPLALPGQIFRYHGEQWLDDLSMVAMNQAGMDVWRLAPAGFDDHGNPIFQEWKKLLTDPVFEARVAGKADAVHGGNEMAQMFSSDWAMTDGSMEEGFYVNARGGPSFSANEGSQTKISRYVPDGKGGFQLKWRTGREAMQKLAEPGDIYGAIHMHAPINGLLSVIDQSRCGVLLYTTDGMYVDTIFPDGRRFSPAAAGVYPQPGEYFAGMIYPDQKSGKIYFGMGKYTPMLFEAEGWTRKNNPATALSTVQKTVKISAAQVASPPEIALSVRGGAGKAKIARFAPALGGAALDGSMSGWESCEPVAFSAGKDQTVEVRCLYDPEHLYLRWHARLGGKFQAAALQPMDRIFTHDRLADTLSIYFQGDPEAKPGGAPEGRAGDLRIVFGMFEDGGKVVPAALGMYPKWSGKGSPLTYKTPVGTAAFEHIGPVEGGKLFGKVDEDGKGFVIVAEIPKAAIPNAPALVGGLRTQVNFSATFGGHNKFWWANSDGSASRETYDEPTEARLYPGSWSPAQFQGLDSGVVVRNWLICGPFGGAGAEKFKEDANPQAMKDAVRKFSEAGRYPPDDGKVDLKAVYSGEMVRGYWNDPGQVKWKAATIADLDTRVTLGPSAQTWYGVTWMHVPEETELEFAFQGHPQTFLKYFLNGEVVFEGEIKQVRDTMPPVAKKQVKLRAGWNQVMFRGYCIGYPPFRAGLVVGGEEAKLWKLKVSAVAPPQE